MKETKIYLIRHGQSLGNANRIYLGHTDLDLSEEGYKQAEITAIFLKDVHIDSIYSSDLLRAYNTAIPHAKMRGIKVMPSKQLREIFLGNWENKTLDELIEKYNDEFTIGWKENFGTFTVPGGESVLEAGNRFYNEVLRIAKENPEKTILIASHAAVIRSFWCRINKIKPEDYAKSYPFPTNASYSIAIYDGESIKPIEYSCDSHFEESKPKNTL